MKVVILAAGNGTRLSLSNNQIPKCLISKNNQKNLQRIVNFFMDYNFLNSDLFVVIGEEGKCWTSDNKRIIKKIVPNTIINKHNLTTNNAYSLRLALDFIKKDDIIILDGDLFLMDSLIVKKFIECQYSCILGKVIKNNFGNKNLIRKDKNNRVLEFGKNTNIGKQLIMYGPMLKLIKSDYNLFTSILYEEQYYSTNIDRVLDKFSLCANTRVFVDNSWLNVNTPSDLKLLD